MKKNELVRKIRKEFPELKFKTAKHNVEGWDHYVLILDNKYVFRFPRTAEYLRKLKTEVPCLDYLKDKVNLQIPQYKFVAKDKTFAGYEIIHGLQLEKSVFDKLSKPTKLHLAWQLAKFLTAMHKVPLKVARLFDSDIEIPEKLQKETQDKTRKYIFPKVSKTSRLLIEDFFLEFKANCLKYPNKVLVHTDFYPKHILLSANKKTLVGIIDFADRSLDDPAFDFCELLVYGKEFLAEVYKHYQGPKDKNFLHRAELYYKRMPIWMMISTCEERKGNFRHEYKRFRETFNQYK
jgi:aminoglycoside 2''-phosphotransferase